VNWSVIDTPKNFQVYGVTDDTVNVNDPPATYQALYNLNGSSTVYPSNSTKSLRRWVQEDYVYKNFAPGVVDVSISDIGSMYVDVKTWDDASMCIFSKVVMINTRYPDAVTNTGATERNLIGYGATTLTSKRTACVTELGSFYTSLTPWNNVENVKTMYSDSAAVRLLAIKNYLICNGDKLMSWEDWYKKPHPMISETEDADFEVIELKLLPQTDSQTHQKPSEAKEQPLPR
jgi:hypothetical protein